MRFDHADAHALAFREVGPETGPLLERLQHELPVGHTLRQLDAPFERVPSARDRHLVHELGHKPAGGPGARCVELGLVSVMRS